MSGNTNARSTACSPSELCPHNWTSSFIWNFPELSGTSMIFSLLSDAVHTFRMASGASRLLDDPDIDRTAVDLLYNPIVIDTFAHICNLDIAKPRQKYVLFGNYVTINKVYYGNNRLCLTICN